MHRSKPQHHSGDSYPMMTLTTSLLALKAPLVLLLWQRGLRLVLAGRVLRLVLTRQWLRLVLLLWSWSLRLVACVRSVDKLPLLLLACTISGNRWLK